MPSLSSSASSFFGLILWIAGGGAVLAGGWALRDAMQREEPALAIPAPVLRTETVPADSPVTTTEPRIWQPIFGEAPAPVAPPPPAPPPPEIVEDTSFVFDDSLYALRGVVVTDAGGWAMIESEGRVQIFRPGDMLETGEEVLEITEEGVLIDLFGDEYFMEFTDRPPAEQPPPTGAARNEAGRNRMGFDDGFGSDGQQYFDDVIDLTQDAGDIGRQLGIGR